MKFSHLTARVCALAIVSAAVAGCSSTGNYFNPGQRGLDQRYGTESSAPAPRYGHWTMNTYEREAEKKAIAQDQPFATVVPSRY